MRTDRARWRTSSRSGGTANCVEVADNLPGAVLVRDSKLGEHSAVLDFDRPAWAAFIYGVRAGEFDPHE